MRVPIDLPISLWKGKWLDWEIEVVMYAWSYHAIASRYTPKQELIEKVKLTMTSGRRLHVPDNQEVLQDSLEDNWAYFDMIRLDLGGRLYGLCSKAKEDYNYWYQD